MNMPFFAFRSWLIELLAGGDAVVMNVEVGSKLGSVVIWGQSQNGLVSGNVIHVGGDLPGIYIAGYEKPIVEENQP